MPTDPIRLTITAADDNASTGFILSIARLPSVYSISCIIATLRYPDDVAIRSLPKHIRAAAYAVRRYADEDFGLPRADTFHSGNVHNLWRETTRALLRDLVNGRAELDQLTAAQIAAISETLAARAAYPTIDDLVLDFPLFHLELVRASRQSPLELVAIVTGPLAAAFTIILVTEWMLERAEHNALDIENKRLAVQAAEIVVQKLRQNQITVTSDAVAAVLQNARITQAPLPRIADIKIDVA
ncbi:MAG TPA: hypothetical protein VE974_06140 [Thermoanaerobaculia bacterium]|nr:hypothetical protein [Thermoanaerobaculia bacterium]